MQMDYGTDTLNLFDPFGGVHSVIPILTPTIMCQSYVYVSHVAGPAKRLLVRFISASNVRWDYISFE